MTLQELQTLLRSLKLEAYPELKRGNLSRLRGIAKTSAATQEADARENYVTYLTEKYH